MNVIDTSFANHEVNQQYVADRLAKGYLKIPYNVVLKTTKASLVIK